MSSHSQSENGKEEEEWVSSSDREDNNNVLSSQSLAKEHVNALSMPPASTRSNYSILSSADGTYTSGARAEGGGRRKRTESQQHRITTWGAAGTLFGLDGIS